MNVTTREVLGSVGVFCVVAVIGWVFARGPLAGRQDSVAVIIVPDSTYTRVGSEKPPIALNADERDRLIGERVASELLQSPGAGYLVLIFRGKMGAYEDEGERVVREKFRDRIRQISKGVNRFAEVHIELEDDSSSYAGAHILEIDESGKIVSTSHVFHMLNLRYVRGKWKAGGFVAVEH